MNDIVLSIVLSTLLILLLIAGIALAFFMVGRQRIRQEKQLAENRLAFEREIRQVETEVAEQLLARFAGELHDNVGQLLTAMHIQIQNHKMDHPQTAQDFGPMENCLAEVTQQVRLLGRTLNNDYIGRIGLLAALRIEADRLRSLRRFALHWEPGTGTIDLSKDQELMLFRIFQEITQNALRHSAARNLYLETGNGTGNLVLSVRDDGKGFDPDEVLRTAKASGLGNIVKRAAMAGLTCRIEAAPGKGAAFVFEKVSP